VLDFVVLAKVAGLHKERKKKQLEKTMCFFYDGNFPD
jgi:hypothetical protein